jgi:peroxiredoxin
MKLLTTVTILVTALLFGAAMPATASTATGAVLTPGTKAPDFTLLDTTNQRHVLGDYLAQGKIVVLEWFNPDCPFVVKHHKHHRTMAEAYTRFKDRGVVWLAINSGAPGLQGHGLERNKKAHDEFGMLYPVLLDPTGRVGKQYGARTSPHMFVIKPDGVLVYNGAIDDNRSATELGATNHVVEALQAVIANLPVKVAETRPYGCSVKYAD